MDYATRLLNIRLQMIHEMNVADPEESAEYDVDVFSTR